ncbi:MAG TPA: extensin family protein [Polyangiales bacterium]|nr:extensin family protein [Polyangiales bacterium]
MERRIATLVALSLVTSCSRSPRTVLESQTSDQCYSALAAEGVRFERVPAERAAGIDAPIVLSGDIHGIRVFGGKQDAKANYLDCRLALALVEWAPLLQQKGVAGLQHYSMYRADATIGSSNKTSGHARGRAIDVGSFELRDGRRLSVLEQWKNRKRGAPPCEVASSSDAEALMRDLACEAIEREIFQTVITPHYNDAHANHVHLEIGAPEAEWVR